MKSIILLSLITLFFVPVLLAYEVEFSQQDRDRILRTELRLEEFQKQSAIQFENIQKQFDGVQGQFIGIQEQINNQQNFLYWAFGIMISFMGFLLGLVIWDRRTTLSPVKRETEEVRRENQRLINVMRSYAEQQPVLKEILKSAGLL